MVGSLVVDERKFPTRYIELRLAFYLLSGCFVRNGNTTKDVLLVVIVGHRVDKRIDSELLLPLTAVYYEVRAKQHEIGQLIPLCSKPAQHQLKHQPSQPAARHQNQPSFLYIARARLYYLRIVILLY